MRVCTLKATGRLIEAQSHARPGTLTANAVNAGYAADDVEERDATDAEFEALLAVERHPRAPALTAEHVFAWALDEINAIRERNGLTAYKDSDARAHVRRKADTEWRGR